MMVHCYRDLCKQEYVWNREIKQKQSPKYDNWVSSKSVALVLA